jgi:hypothetical protein
MPTAPMGAILIRNLTTMHCVATKTTIFGNPLRRRDCLPPPTPDDRSGQQGSPLTQCPDGPDGSRVRTTYTASHCRCWRSRTVVTMRSGAIESPDLTSWIREQDVDRGSAGTSLRAVQ